MDLKANFVFDFANISANIGFKFMEFLFFENDDIELAIRDFVIFERFRNQLSERVQFSNSRGIDLFVLSNFCLKLFAKSSKPCG